MDIFRGLSNLDYKYVIMRTGEAGVKGWKYTGCPQCKGNFLEHSTLASRPSSSRAAFPALPMFLCVPGWPVSPVVGTACPDSCPWAPELSLLWAQVPHRANTTGHRGWGSSGVRSLLNSWAGPLGPGAFKPRHPRGIWTLMLPLTMEAPEGAGQDSRPGPRAQPTGEPSAGAFWCCWTENKGSVWSWLISNTRGREV